MQEEGLVARARKRYKVTTMSDHDQPVVANLLDRQFEVDAPNQRWVGDTTGSSSAAAANCTSRRSWICGLAVHRGVGRQRGERPARDHQGLGDGAQAPVPGPASSIIPIRVVRSDASEDYQDLLEARGIVCSIADVATLGQFRHGELLLDRQERARRTLRQSRRREDGVVRLRAEMFYNQRRRHSTLGQISPPPSNGRRRRAWTLPSLRTHRTRPQGFGNLAQNARFPQRPHPSSLL